MSRAFHRSGVLESLGDWSVERQSTDTASILAIDERLLWQDQTTPLRSSFVEVDGVSAHRLSLGHNLAVDILPGDRIEVHHAPELSTATIDHFLADQVYPRLIASRGAFVVHAGAVHTDSSAFLLMGPSGRGKSTLTASFDRAGHRLLGDDAMVISSLSDRPNVQAVYRSLRLFADSIAALMPGEQTAGPVAHFTTKERIEMTHDDGVADAPVPVSAIFVLGGADSGKDIVVRPLTVADSCMMLVESSFALDPSDVAQASKRLADASAVARAVPAFQIAYPRNYARLAEVRQAILAQIAALEQA